MQKWEYRAYRAKKPDTDPTMESERSYRMVPLKALGEEGWEAVGIVVVDEYIVVLFKRPKP